MAAALFAASGLATADPIWAGHFPQAYMPPTERSAFASYVAISEVTAGDVTSREGKRVTDRLLWRSKYPL